MPGTDPNPDDSSAASERSRADHTRMALVRAALHLFGAKGFDGTSTRDIAAAANANIGSIAYHFGGKEGLRTACAAFIVETIQTIAGQALSTIQPRDAAEAEAVLAGALDRMVAYVIAQPEAGEIVQFVLRELSHPTTALDAIYEGVFAPTHKRLCQVWAQATGEDAESERTKLTVFTLIGQVIYFRIGRVAVMRRMGWAEMGPEEASAITAITKENVSAILAARRATP